MIFYWKIFKEILRNFLADLRLKKKIQEIYILKEFWKTAKKLIFEKFIRNLYIFIKF